MAIGPRTDILQMGSAPRCRSCRTVRTFYYSDYRVAGGMKVYYWDAWPCCAGTYLQAVADYPNLIYYKDASSLYM